MLMIICTNVGAFITKWTIDAPIDCTICQFLKNFKVKGPLSCPKTMFPMFHAEKIWQNDMLHDLVIPKIIEVAVIMRIGHLTYFRPKFEISNTALYQYIHFLTFHIILRRTRSNNAILWAIIWEIASQLWFDDVIITYTSYLTKWP